MTKRANDNMPECSRNLCGKKRSRGVYKGAGKATHPLHTRMEQTNKTEYLHPPLLNLIRMQQPHARSLQNITGMPSTNT